MYIHKICSYIIEIFLKYKMVEPNKASICIYGLELICSSILNICIVGLVAFFLDDLKGYFLFLFAFIPFRLLVGGYHANSHITCCFYFVILYICTFIGDMFILQEYHKFIILIMALISLCLIVKYSPVDHPNKKVSKLQKKRNRKKSISLSLIYLILAILPILPIFKLYIPSVYIFRLLNGELLASFSLITGIIKKQKSSIINKCN